MPASGIALSELAEAARIVPGYWDIHGVYHEASEESVRLLLEAMDLDCSSDSAANLSTTALEQGRWLRLCSPVSPSIADDNKLTIELYLSQEVDQYTWELKTETGESLQGAVAGSEISWGQQREFSGIKFRQAFLSLSLSIPVGYHRFDLLCQRQKVAESLVITSPRRCWLPEMIKGGQRAWGASVQLYGVHSNNSWGIGDFADLKELINWTSSIGADCVGLNPLHALSLSPFPQISPYSPSNRAAYNPIYISIPEAAEFLDFDINDQLNLFWPVKNRSDEACPKPEFVSYQKVIKAKLEALLFLSQKFFGQPNVESTAQHRAFAAYCQQRGESLRQFSIYCALQQRLGEKDSNLWGWPVWPEEYREPGTAAVLEFARQNAELVRFYQFTQWLVESQLSAVDLHSKNQGFAIGLYLDLALGTASGSFETWINKNCYALDVNAGAPPDLLAPQGQDWGLPPYIPDRIREIGYKPFIEVIRATMRYAGALRIDHVMSLLRLYWVPRNATGAYVTNYLDELLGIIAIESNRGHCCVIGEDLGTVPDEIRVAMNDRGILSYKVLFFEKNNDGSFRKPEQYPELALVTASTHDLPTMHGYWAGSDLELRKELELHQPEILEQLTAWRREDWEALQAVLVGEEVATRLTAEDFARLGQYLLARTPSALQVVQLEDLVGEQQQSNLPGTTTEHPNWQRKLKLSVEELSKDEQIRQLLVEINRLRTES